MDPSEAFILNLVGTIADDVARMFSFAVCEMTLGRGNKVSIGHSFQSRVDFENSTEAGQISIKSYLCYVKMESGGLGRFS